MLPADFCNLKHDVRTLSSGLSFPRRDDGQDHLPFLTYHARPLQPRGCPRTRRAVIRGEPHIRPPTKIPLPVRSHLRGFARLRYLGWRATSVDFRLRSSVTIDVHGSLDRAKDVSSSGSRLLGATSKSACAWRMLTTFPSSFFQRTPVVAGAFACLGTSPLQTRRTGQDSHCSARPRRLTASCESGCLSPLRREERDESGDCSAFPWLPAPVLRSRRPHVLPMAGDNVLWRTLQAPLSALPGKDFGEQDTFSTAL
jgi:hypothetical protein